MAAYTRCLRCAGAHRRPASGSGLSLLIPSWHAALSDLGEFDHRFGPEHRCRHWPSPWTKGLGTPNNPAIRFTRGTVFAATLVRDCYGLSGCWPPCTDLTGLPANGGFYFQAFDGSVTLPVAGYNYNSVWLCWRDFHPLEWQLASLHWSGRAVQVVSSTWLMQSCITVSGL